MTRFVPAVLVALVLVAFGGIAAACGGSGGGGGTLTLEEYFQRLEEISAKYDERGTELENEFNLDEATSQDEVIEITTGLFAAGSEALKDFVDELDGLNPPDEVTDIHNDAIEAGRGAVASFEDLVDQIEGAESAADFEALFQSDLFGGGAAEEFTAKCDELQQIASDNGIEVDLECGD